MARYLSVLKNAWLIVWNLALLCLFVGVPVVAVYKGGWVGVAFLAVLGFALFLFKHPTFAIGMWISGRR